MLRPNYQALKYRLHRLMSARDGATAGFLDLADSVRVLHPGVTEPSPPAIYLASHLEKIENICCHRTHELEDAKIFGRPWTHAPTVEYQFSDVTLNNGYLYKRQAKLKLVPHREKLFRGAADKRVMLEKGFLACSFSGNCYFGPFLREDVPMSLLADDYLSNFVVTQTPFRDESSYRMLLDCPRPEAYAEAIIKYCTLYQDFGKNPGKALRYKELRQRVRKFFSRSALSCDEVVYLKRGMGGSRRTVANEQELEQYFEKVGIAVVEPGRLDAVETAKKLFDAKLVISVEGSHISHAVYTIADNATILVLQPPDRFSTAFKDFTDCLGMRFGFVVGSGDVTGFHVDQEDLARVIDRCLV
jgi:hypothetical protein